MLARRVPSETTYCPRGLVLRGAYVVQLQALFIDDKPVPVSNTKVINSHSSALQR
jgi:hypothetical protein